MNPSDYTTISFPFLGLELNPGRGFDIGPLTVNFYGLIIGIGLLLAATLEEVLFRGLLLPVLCKKNVLTGSVITGLVFAFAHFLNLGTGAGLPFILVQVVYALAIGFSLSGIALSCDSLLPCIGIHFLVNITAGDSLVVSPYLQPLFWAGILLSFICGFRSIYLLKNKPHEERVSYETIH